MGRNSSLDVLTWSFTRDTKIRKYMSSGWNSGGHFKAWALEHRQVLGASIARVLPAKLVVPAMVIGSTHAKGGWQNLAVSETLGALECRIGSGRISKIWCNLAEASSMDTPSVVGSREGGRIKSGVRIWWVGSSDVIEDASMSGRLHSYCGISVWYDAV
jgi:hypothetical protein